MNYDANCNRCDRLNDFLSVSKKKYPDYFCKPVPAFGDKNIKLLIVGLAPGLHGANKTGRPFTGDHAGIILYETLFKHVSQINRTQRREVMALSYIIVELPMP